MHFDVFQSSNPEYNQAIIKIEVFKTHKQFIRYIEPTDYDRISQVRKRREKLKRIQADLVIVDEAAAIPMIYVKEFIGPYIVFISSTVNGYEGTGRSLSLKLIQKLREQNKIETNSLMKQETKAMSGSGVRLFKEITLTQPIRYSTDDPIENWLNDLLLLNVWNYN